MGVPTGVMPIEGQTAAAFEVIELERLLDDDLKCQVIHLHRDCSVEVTHRLRWCGGSSLMCQRAAERNEECIRGYGRCAGCLGMCADCWDIRAI